jgi:hypothetical protein
MSTRRRWTPETIQAELAPIVAELGRFPKREELAERGLSGLTTAMTRNGGVAAWREKFAAAPAETPAAAAEAPAFEVTHEVIATHAYFLALQQGGADPVATWLAAERELASLAA